MRNTFLPIYTSLAACALGCLFIAPAAAGPWEIGSTDITSRHKLSAKFTHKHTRRKDSYTPSLKVKGPLATHVQYQVSNGYGYIHRSGADNRHGLTDLSTKLKWRIMDANEQRPAVAIEPKLTLKTGDSAAGTGGTVNKLKLPLRAAKQIRQLRYTLEVSYTHAFSTYHADQWAYGALLEYLPTSRLTLGADLIASKARHDSRKSPITAEIGFKYKAFDSWKFEGLLARRAINRRGDAKKSVKLVAQYTF